MTRTARALVVCGIACAAAGGPACSNDEPGIVVNVDLAGFKPATMRIAIDAGPAGFMAQAEHSVDNVEVKTEDIDGNGTLELVTKFLQPRGSLAFRNATANDKALDVRGHAFAFDDTQMIADAESAAAVPLPPGGRESVALTLKEHTDVVGPMTQTTDILTAMPSVTIATTSPAHYSSVAVCDVDGDKKPDLVLGAPEEKRLNLTAAGAVYVLLGKGGFGAQIDPDNGNTVTAFHFSGLDAGDRLGATVACADLNGDGVGDVIAGAPGAAGGTGRVYAVIGNGFISTQPITPESTGADAPDITWTTTGDTALGSLLFAADLNGDGKAEVLVGTTSKRVHLLKNVTARTAPISVDGGDHITFSGIDATAIAAGNLRHVAGGVDVVIGDSAAMRSTVTMGGGAIFGFPDVKLDTPMQYTAPAMVMYGGDNMLFGAAVLALATTSAGQDLIVGAPGANDAAGAFYLYKGDNNFFGVAERSMDDHALPRMGPLAGGRFGSSLAGTPTGSPPSYSRWDLIVGAPATRRGDNRVLAGAAYLFGGGDGWMFPLYEQVFGASATDGLGTVVAGGDVTGDGKGDLVTIAPNAASGSNNAGIVYVVEGRVP